MPEEQRYLIQFQFLDGKPNLERVKSMFGGTGVVLDCGYPPVLVNSKQNRYVVRGYASAAAREKAEKSTGVQFFADAKQRVIAY